MLVYSIKISRAGNDNADECCTWLKGNAYSDSCSIRILSCTDVRLSAPGTFRICRIDLRHVFLCWAGPSAYDSSNTNGCRCSRRFQSSLIGQGKLGKVYLLVSCLLELSLRQYYASSLLISCRYRMVPGMTVDKARPVPRRQSPIMQMHYAKFMQSIMQSLC